MVRATRHVPPDRDVLREITLGFYHGAKIGVIGPNGAGKSTLLRVMAGEDEPTSGEARLGEGFTVGLLAQEPVLDPDKDVIGNVMEGVAPVQALLDRYQEVLAGWADPEADYDVAGHGAGQPGTPDRGGGRLGPGAQGRYRHGRPPRAPGGNLGDHSVGR